MAVTVLLLVATGSAVDLFRIRRDLADGQRDLSALSLDTVRADGGVLPPVLEAQRHLDHAARVAHHSPFLALLRPIPVVGTQIGAIRDLVDATARIGAIAKDAATPIQHRLDASEGTGVARVALIDEAATQLAKAQARLATVSVGAHGARGPVHTARVRLEAKLAEADQKLDDGRQDIAALRSLLVGPQRYLLLGANNAEMRGGAGMPLTGAVVTFSNGDFGLSKAVATQKLNPKRVGLAADPPKELLTTYARWNIGGDFLETAVSPNFPAIAPIYADMAAGTRFGHVQGVVEVDADALAVLLRVIGPVQLDGQTYNTGNVAQKILNQNYLDFPTGAQRDDRDNLQGRIAAQIFDAIRTRSVPLLDLAGALRTAAKGRHLMLWSRNAVLERLWTQVGADGHIDPNGLMVCVENVSASKLDWYLNPEVTLTVKPAGAAAYTARLTVRITNPTRAVTSPYIEGPVPGRQAVMLAVYLPASAANVRAIDQSFSDGGRDGPMKLAAVRYVIPTGETSTVSMEFNLPRSQKGVTILPAGRVRPQRFSVNGRAYTDARPTPVHW